jgi:peptidoglycan/LPS O-acetylase OafA/YrhL
MDAFALGMLAAWAVRSTAARAWLARRIVRWWLPFAVLAPVLLVLTFARAPQGAWALSLYGYPTLALFFAWSVYVAVVIRPAALISVLEWGPLVNLGRLSYFIYLWHAVVLNIVIWRLLRTREAVSLDGLPSLGAIAVAVALTWALAAVSWKLFEGPLVRLGQRLRY